MRLAGAQEIAGRKGIALALVLAAVALAAPAPAAAEDPNCDPPTFSGEARQGEQLTGAAGACTGAEVPTLEWQRCNEAGQGCVTIATSATYTATAQDVRSRLKLLQTTATGTEEVLTAVVKGHPAASFVFAPSFPRPGQVVVFSSTSTDPDDDALTFEWELDGDNDFNDDSGPTAARSFPTAGDRIVRLRVTDSDGGQDAAARSLSVRTPSASASPAPEEETAAPEVAPELSPMLLSPFPVVVLAGRFTRRGVRITQLAVRGPRDTSVRVRCVGRTCPVKRYRRRIGPRGRVRLRRFERRRLRARTRLGIYARKPGLIGKYTRFRIRRRRQPARLDACLMPGSSRPSRCPSTP